MDAHLLTDIRLELLHQELRPVYAVQGVRRRGPGERGQTLDLATVPGRDNLAQALIMRLLTPQGELAGLGHPDYGSRLHELVGRPNNETTRRLLRLRILETLQREPRVEEILEVKVGPAPGRRSSVDVVLRIKPTGSRGIVTIGPFTLGLEQ